MMKFSPGKLRRARIKKGLSCEVLAVSVQRTRNTVVNWEKNRTVPDANEACALADVLGCPLADLFTAPKS